MSWRVENQSVAGLNVSFWIKAGFLPALAMDKWSENVFKLLARIWQKN